MLDTADLEKLSTISTRPELPDSLRQSNISEMASAVPILFNTLNIRRAIIPAANGHCSARALARYYATLAAGGVVPPPHSSLSKPLLGSHVQIPEFPKINKKKNGIAMEVGNGDAGRKGAQLFVNSKIHDAFMGTGDYKDLVIPDGKFGLGFRKFQSSGGRSTSFGHSGVGGSTGFCDIEHDFAIAVTVNRMSLGGATRSIVQLVCSELGVPLPQEFSDLGEKGPDMQLNMGLQSQ